MRRGTVAMNIVYREDVRSKKSFEEISEARFLNGRGRQEFRLIRLRLVRPTTLTCCLTFWENELFEPLIYGSRTGKRGVISFIRCRDWALAEPQTILWASSKQFCRGGRVYWKECRGNKLLRHNWSWLLSSRRVVRTISYANDNMGDVLSLPALAMIAYERLNVGFGILCPFDTSTL